ncbi:MAG: hypothetical protein IT372_15870 [Polyangiaceae bacterium]|nr:hypothetical protein [Polyangiaceae bacterium]
MRGKNDGHAPGGAAAVVQYSEIDGVFGYIYAIGEVHARFPSQDVEKEFQQLCTEEDIKAPTFEQRLYDVLRRGENLYFAREMAWVFEIENVSTYMLRPRSDVELTQLIAAIEPERDPTQIEFDVVIGVHEPLPPRGDGERDLPWVTVNRLFHFEAKAFLDRVPLPAAIQCMPAGPAKDAAIAQFRSLVYTIFNDMLQLADNTGDADEHRALNYVSLNYPDIYGLMWLLPSPPTGGSWTFTGVEVRRSALSGARRIMDVIFKYTDTSAGVVTRYFTSVDVTGQFPFLVTKLQPYFDR